MFGMLWGVLFLGEVITWQIGIGCVVILIASIVIFQGESQLLVLKLEEKVYGNQSVQMRIANGSDLKGKIPIVGDELTIGLRKLDSFIVE